MNVDATKELENRKRTHTLSSAFHGRLVALEQRQHPAEHAPGVVADRRGRVAVLAIPRVVVVVVRPCRPTASRLPWAGRHVTIAALDKSFFEDFPTTPSISDPQCLLCNMRQEVSVHAVVGKHTGIFREARQATGQRLRSVGAREFPEQILCCGCRFWSGSKG